MRKIAYKKLVAIAAEYAASSDCSYAVAAEFCGVSEQDLVAFVGSYDDDKQAATQGN